jgi:hypothetical protein
MTKHPKLPDAEQITLDNEDSSSPNSPDPSHIMTGNYVALMETNGKECESWYYFIRREGNEEALKHLNDQLVKVDWYILDDLSTFDLDLDHNVSAITAKEMTKIELNSYAFHRKFDGKLDNINLGFKKKDKNEKMICKTFDQLGYGQIEDYISDEDLDPEDLISNSESDSESESESEEEENENENENSGDESNKKDEKKVGGIPPALLACDRPRWAKAKGKKAAHRR